MSLHYWLGWLAFCLAWLWLGQTLQRPLPEPVAIAPFADGYLIPREFRFTGETFADGPSKQGPQSIRPMHSHPGAQFAGLACYSRANGNHTLEIGFSFRCI